MGIEFYKVYTATKLAVTRLRRDVRSGHETEARNFVRFIRNAGILTILRNIEFPPGLIVDAALLEWEVTQLEGELSAQNSAPETQSDSGAIRASLDLIAARVAMIPLPSVGGTGDKQRKSGVSSKSYARSEKHHDGTGRGPVQKRRAGHSL